MSTAIQGATSQGDLAACLAYAADMPNGGLSATETGTLQAAAGGERGQSLNSLPCLVQAFQSSQSGVCLGESHATLEGNNGSRRHNGVDHAIVSADNQLQWIVRRLTPLECLRLQGFDDNWLDGVELRGKPLSDSHKYKLVGNSWAVPCAAYIFDRIRAWDRLYVERALLACGEMESAGLEVWTTIEWGAAGFRNDDATLGVLWIDDEGYRVIDREGKTPAGLGEHPRPLEECLADIRSAEHQSAVINV